MNLVLISTTYFIGQYLKGCAQSDGNKLNWILNWNMWQFQLHCADCIQQMKWRFGLFFLQFIEVCNMSSVQFSMFSIALCLLLGNSRGVADKKLYVHVLLRMSNFLFSIGESWFFNMTTLHCKSLENCLFVWSLCKSFMLHIFIIYLKALPMLFYLWNWDLIYKAL